MSCVTVPTPASDGMELWRRALRSESGKRHNRVATSVATSTKNAPCTPMPHGHQTVPNLIPRVNSLLTMAKGRLAEHFREDRLGLLRQCGFKSTTRGGTVFTLFWCCLAPAAGSTAYSESADVLAAKYLRLNQTIGSGGIGETLQTYRSATEEEWKVERRRPSRGRT